MSLEILSKTGDQNTCVAAAVIRDGKILLGYRNYTPDKWKQISVWTTPGGRCDPGETIEQTLRRETREETGIIDLNIIEYLGEVPGAKAGDFVPVFVCATKQDAVLMEPEKFSQWRWVPFVEYLSGAPWNEMNPAAHTLIAKYLQDSKIMSA